MKMAHLKSNKIPTKKKQKSCRIQRSNLHNYFHLTECITPEENIKDTRLSGNQLCVKRKLDGGFQQNTQTDEITAQCSQNKMFQPQVLVKKLDMSDISASDYLERKSKLTAKPEKTTVTYEAESNLCEEDCVQEESIMETPIKESINRISGIPSVSSLVEQSTIDDSIEIDMNNITNTPSLQEQTKNNYRPTIPKIGLKNQIKVSAPDFKNIIYSFCFNDYCKPYQKLSVCQFPQCYDLKTCKSLHNGLKAEEVNSFQYGHVFNLLDNPLADWMCDMLPVIALVVNSHQCLRGDMLRILFDYVLNGPSKELMWDIKAILDSHWSLHPPCSEHMQNIYLQLLDRPYRADSFFKTNLLNSGVLTYVLDQLEKVLCSKTDDKDVLSKNKNETDDQTPNTEVKELTFEVMEERYKNLQPLFEKEQQEIIDAVNELNSSQVELDNVTLDDSEILDRLTIALEVIVDLLEADFLICISRLKHYIKGDCKPQEPLMSHFIDDTSQLKILKLYVSSKNPKTWKQLSRLIGLMAETIHLFKFLGIKVWKYPNIHPECESFAASVFEQFSKGDWVESDRLIRLQVLRPPWLQQRVTLAVVNSHLNLDLGTGIGLHALVDIIHTHVISPVKLKKNLKKVELKLEKSELIPEKYLKNAQKRNHYGETQLHLVCRRKKSTVEDLKCLLSLPETDINARDHHGHTPLHEAVYANSLEKTEVLLQFQPPSGRDSVDVGAQNKDGNTPLHEALEAKDPQLKICQLLVEYGGICLLRKKNNQGVTPRMLAHDKKVISDFFESEIKAQEALNLNSNSVLKLSDNMIRMCMIICDAFIADHHTWELYEVLKYNKDYVRATPEPYITCCKDILVKFKRDQDHFRKLRRIIEKLADNPQNSFLVKVWNYRFLHSHTSSVKVS